MPRPLIRLLFFALVALLTSNGIAASLPPEALLAKESGDGLDIPPGWVLSGAVAKPGRTTFRFLSASGGSFSIQITPRDDSQRIFAQSASFNISHVDPMGSMDSPEGRLLGAVVRALKRNDHGQVEITTEQHSVEPRVPADVHEERRQGPGFWSSLSGMEPLDQAQVWAVIALLSVALLGFALALRLQWLSWIGMGWSTRISIAAALVGAVAIRMFVAPRLVMIYSAFNFTDKVAAFEEVSRYGAGASTLYRLLFCVVPPDHFAIVRLHTLLGLLTIPAAVTYLRRHLPEGSSAPVFAVLLALTPMFIRDHRTESILVVGVFYLWYGLLLLDGFLDGRRRSCLAGSLAFLGLALFSRPEMVAITPAAILVAVASRGRAGVRGAMLPLGIAGGVFAVVFTLHLLHLTYVVPQQVAADSLPGLNTRVFQAIQGGMIVRNAWLQSAYFPLGITAFAVLGLVAAPPRTLLLALGFCGLALLWTAVYFIDLPITSQPRLHAPASMIIALLAALGADSASRLSVRLPVWARLSAAVVAVVCVAFTALPSIPSLFATTNEDQEERLFRRAAAALPEEQVCLFHISSMDDPPEGKTHRYHADYLLRPPHRDDRVYQIIDYPKVDLDQDCRGGAYFYMGLLCYAAMWEEADAGTSIERVVETSCTFDPGCWRLSYRNLDLEKPDRPAVLSSCARFIEDVEMEPVFEDDLENLGDNEYGYYPEVSTFRVGLYRLSNLPH